MALRDSTAEEIQIHHSDLKFIHYPFLSHVNYANILSLSLSLPTLFLSLVTFFLLVQKQCQFEDEELCLWTVWVLPLGTLYGFCGHFILLQLNVARTPVALRET